jgi:hypothetical protein
LHRISCYGINLKVGRQVIKKKASSIQVVGRKPSQSLISGKDGRQSFDYIESVQGRTQKLFLHRQIRATGDGAVPISKPGIGWELKRPT